MSTNQGGTVLTDTCSYCEVFIEWLADDQGCSWYHVDGTTPYRQCKTYAKPKAQQ